MIKFTAMDEDGEEVEYELPSKKAVCSRCEGHGTHLSPSIGEHCYSQEEFDESFSTDEEKEEYFKRGGIYDVTCEQCGGKRVEDVVDEDACEKEPYKSALEKYNQKLAEEYYAARERAAERRMGC